MKLTTKSEYALLALLHMARRQEDEYVKVDEICNKYGISKKYLEYLFTILRQSGYVKTRRGSGGGYALAKPAGKVSIAQIIRLMDGALAPTESVSKYFYAETPLKKEKKVLAVFQDIRDYIARKLEKLTLADLA